MHLPLGAGARRPTNASTAKTQRPVALAVRASSENRAIISHAHACARLDDLHTCCLVPGLPLLSTESCDAPVARS